MWGVGACATFISGCNGFQNLLTAVEYSHKQKNQMAINYSTKAQLAKLLATEDLIVENQEVSTAQFNVETRVLTLPMWKRASNSVYDMLVGHEVGHALFTPNDWSFEDKVPQQFVNVTEDARIEKLMKRKYPGLLKSFTAGYKELAEQDFFCIEDEDIDEMNLADRANLYFKIGKYLDIIFTHEESKIIEQIGDAETFDEAVEAAIKLYQYCKGSQQEKQPMPQPPQSDGQSGGEQQVQVEVQAPDAESSGSSDEKLTSKNSEPSSDLQDGDDGEESGSNPESKEPEVQTDSTFEQQIEDLCGNMNGNVTEYFELPDFNLEKIIVPFNEIRTKFQWAEDIYNNDEKQQHYQWVDSEYNKFRKSAAREVNYLVKEFECRKSADAYARASTSRTGVLDCSKLHTYKYNEDLFKKVTTLADGKNHGLVFVLDWSGSMAECLLDTIKQLFNLVWFCNKVNIPFDVYAFTNAYVTDEKEARDHIWEEGKFIIDGSFRMMNLLTSRASKKDLEKQMLSIYRMVFGYRRYCSYNYPGELYLSGTPLNEAIVSLHKIIPAFKKMHGLQKTHVFVLTDGEANAMMVARENSYGGQGGRYPIAQQSYLRNRKTGFTYQFQHEYYRFTQLLLENLKQENKDVNFIGIRLCAPRTMNDFIRRYEYVTEDTNKKIKKDKFYDIKDTGYTSYFAMQTSALNNQAEFEVEEGASKAKIKSAFVKNLKTKALNKKVLSKFMELVA